MFGISFIKHILGMFDGLYGHLLRYRLLLRSHLI